MHWGWTYDGVNASIPRNTGPECIQYLSTIRHVIESAVLIPIAIITFQYGISKLPSLNINYDGLNRIVVGKQLLLITMAVLLGLEMGFKLCTRTAIYILNPCHVTSILQVYLLAAKPSKWTTTLFRIHINYLNGPLLAFLFPEHESRKITFELPTYYIQHGLMFVIPAYLLRQGGPYSAERITDFSYSIVAYGIFIFYHYGFLEFFAVSAQVNLNHMICPAILDPFQGENYRLYACVHQALLCPIISKIFAYIFTPVLPLDKLERKINGRKKKINLEYNHENQTDEYNESVQKDQLTNENNVNSIDKSGIEIGCDISINLPNNSSNLNKIVNRKLQ